MDVRLKSGEHEGSVRIAQGGAESNSSFLNALVTSRVLHNSIYSQVKAKVKVKAFEYIYIDTCAL